MENKSITGRHGKKTKQRLTSFSQNIPQKKYRTSQHFLPFFKEYKHGWGQPAQAFHNNNFAVLKVICKDMVCLLIF